MSDLALGVDIGGTKVAAVLVDSAGKVVASDRGVERAWYNFKNDRATKAIESWLRAIGLRR